MKGDGKMATSTFERKIEISSEKSIEKLIGIISEQYKAEPISATPYTKVDRDRGEQLLKQFLSHSKY